MGSVITVGLSPAWDVVCCGDDIEWGRHCCVAQERIVAGKAFNISRCLGWMGKKSVAAGFWGESDFGAMEESVQSLGEFVDVRFTPAAGSTRESITVIDEAGGREMHLISQSMLASGESLKRLKEDLVSIVNAESVCVLAGSMPGGELEDGVVEIAEMLKHTAGEVVVDTSGEALRYLVGLGEIGVIKPNLSELCDLLGREIEDSSGAIVEAARGLLDKVETIVVSRGVKGAVVVTKEAAWEGVNKTCGKVVSTVGCGDYLLAGFVSGGDIESRLEKGIKAATVRAWGLAESISWEEVQGRVDVEIRQL